MVCSDRNYPVASALPGPLPRHADPTLSHRDSRRASQRERSERYERLRLNIAVEVIF